LDYRGSAICTQVESGDGRKSWLVKQVSEFFLSQSEFARLMRVSTKTLQNWEQHRRNPTGPARCRLAQEY
jgi:DNA-binding XRE family transcriptional regulator